MTDVIDPTAAFGRPEWEPAGDAMPADLDGPKLLIGTRKGAWLLASDAERARVGGRPGRCSSATSSSTWCSTRATAASLLAACRTGHLGPDGVPLAPTSALTWSEASKPPAFAEGDAHGRSLNAVFWLTPGPRRRAGHLVRRRLTAGPVPHRGPRRHLGAGGGLERPPALGRWAEWPDVEGTPDGSMLHSVIIDPRDAAAPLPRALGRRRVRVDRRRRRLGAAQRRAARPTSCPTRTPSTATTRTPSGCTRSSPTGSTSRTTAASTGSTAPTPRGCASATTCRATSATSASRSSCTRAIPTPRGCSRWTAPTCGRAPAPTAARRSTSPATPASRGRARTTGSPSAGWLTVKRQAMTLDDRDPGRRVLRHHVRRGVGEHRRGRVAGPGSSSTCPEIYSVESG